MIVLVGLIALRQWDPFPVEALRLRAFDLYQIVQPRADENRATVIVDIDNESLAEIGQWPWPRTILARLTNQLTRLGAAAIGHDANPKPFFAEPDRLSPDQLIKTTELGPDAVEFLSGLPNNDAVFADALSQSRVVLGQATTSRPSDGAKTKFKSKASLARKGPDPRPLVPVFGGLVRNIEILEQAAGGIGMVIINPDNDGVVRRIPAVIRVGKKLHPAFTVEMLRVAMGGKSYAVVSNEVGIQYIVINSDRGGSSFKMPTDRTGGIWVRFSPSDPNRYVPARAVLDGSVAPEMIKGKLVLVGTSAAGLFDLRNTPIDANLPGVEVHAHILETVVHHQSLERPTEAQTWELLAILIAGLLMVVLVPLIGARWTLGFVVFLLAVLVGGSWYLYSEERALLDATAPAIVTLVLYVLLTYVGYSREATQRRQVRGAFGQYLSPALVEQLAEDPDRLKLGGEMRDLTLMFMDVRGLTTISEQFKGDPEGLTRLVNQVLTPLTDIILTNNDIILTNNADSAKAQWRQVADQLRPKVPKLAVLMDEAEHDVLAYMTFPKEHRQKLHSTNPIERLHAEVKRRTNVVGIFPNEAAITRLVGAILLEQNDEWAVSRRYMTLESIAPLSDGVPITLPTVAA